MAPDELKPEYGKALASGQFATTYAAALSLGLGVGPSLWINDHWQDDPVVVSAKEAEKKRIREEVTLTKGELVSRLLNIADSSMVEPKDRVMAMGKIAVIMGWEQKAQTTINNTNAGTLRQKVIKVTHYATDEDWEAAAARQQSDLLNVATSRK